MEGKILYSEKKKKSEFAGVGAAIQLLGVIILLTLSFAFAYILHNNGIIAGIVIFIFCMVVGRHMSVKWICMNCGNKIDSKDVKICPTCGAHFKP